MLKRKRRTVTMNKYTPLEELKNTKPPSDIGPKPREVTRTFEDVKESLFDYFDKQDYEVNQGFKEGFSRSVSEDYVNTDLIRNLSDIVYDYCRTRNKDMSVEDRSNFKNLHIGLQHIIKAMQQYDNSGTDRVFVAVLLGYMLKVMRNHYHD
jgi:hypothetical protein